MRSVVLVACLLAACNVNTPPRLAVLSNHEVAVNQTVEIFVTAIDVDGDTLNFSVRDKPEAASFEPNALGARFRWTPIASDVPPGADSQDYAVTFIVDDDRGGRDSETVILTVTRSGSGQGGPVFVSPSDYLLDLGNEPTLDVTVTVQDDDAAQVTLSLVQAPEGTNLFPIGPKSAELIWTPTDEQARASTIHAIVVSADDGIHEPVTQEIAVLLRGKAGGTCEGTPPTIVHTSLGDQRSAGPYPVVATITDADSTVRQATLFWTQKGNPTAADFSSVPMVRDGTTNRFTANIPDLGLAAGASATVRYSICATDDDDATGDTCDHVACVPGTDVRYAFVVSPSGTACSDDPLEPNDSSAGAHALTDGAELSSLRICPGNDDWFKIPLAAGQVLDAIVGFTHANGNLDVQAVGPDGHTVVAESRTSSATSNVERIWYPAAAAGTHYLRIFGATSGVTNTYDLSVALHAACVDDGREPNDTPGQAPRLSMGSYSNLTICSGNDDFYKVTLHAGDELDVRIDFTHANGDLDLEVYLPDGSTLLDRSDGVDDFEEVYVPVVPQSGDYLVRVLGYDGAGGNYSLTLAGGTCGVDDFEPNNTTGTAVTVAAGSYGGLSICASDPDFYKMALTAGQHLQVSIRFRNADGDLDLKVLKPDGSALAASVSTDDNENIDVASVPTTGTYFIQVYSLTGARNAYELDVAVTGP